jgi:SPP1 family holin
MIKMAKEKMSVKTVSEVVEVPMEAPKVTAGLVFRTVIFLIAIFNAGAALLGFDIEFQPNQDMIYEFITIAFTAGSFIVAYWKNNNVSKSARVKAAAAEQVKVIRK